MAPQLHTQQFSRHHQRDGRLGGVSFWKCTYSHSYPKREENIKELNMSESTLSIELTTHTHVWIRLIPTYINTNAYIHMCDK